jgi:sensor histidine kinase YesM
MSYARLISFFRLPASTPTERSVLKVQGIVVVGVSLFLALSYAVQREMGLLMEPERLDLIMGSWGGLGWLIWPFFAPVMLVLIRRFPLGVRTRRNIPRLFAWSFALYLVGSNVRFLLRELPSLWTFAGGHLTLDWPTYAFTMILLMPLDFPTFGGIFAASFAIDYYFKNRRRVEEALEFKLRTAQLESDLAQAELKALRGQLHPHFLFNSFNAVTTLMRQHRNDAAVEVVAQLGALLRLAIERTGLQELSLEDEVDFIRRYLQIEGIRFGEKLRFDYQVDPAALNCRVPNLVLQPLVENAIKHGISRRSQPGTVRIAARRHADRLELEIENDGPEQHSAGEAVDVSRVGGVGLSNTRSRLEKIYGADYRLAMIRRADGGMQVKLDIPWRAPLPANS